VDTGMANQNTRFLVAVVHDLHFHNPLRSAPPRLQLHVSFPRQSVSSYLPYLRVLVLYLRLTKASVLLPEVTLLTPCLDSTDTKIQDCHSCTYKPVGSFPYACACVRACVRAAEIK
jgi:hypothetical protein